MTTLLTEPELFLASGDPTMPQPEFLGFKITNLGLVITDEDMSLEKWSDGLRALNQIEGAIGLAKARYIGWGIAKFGREKVDVCFAQLELPLQDIKRAVDISTVPEMVKYRNLNDDHYVALARGGLTKKKMEHWAKIASIQQLSPAQLKSSIHAGEVVSGSTAAHQQHGILSLKGCTSEFQIWERRMGGIDGIAKLEPEVIKEILEDLLPFVTLYNDINAVLSSRPVKKASKANRKK